MMYDSKVLAHCWYLILFSCFYAIIFSLFNVIITLYFGVFFCRDYLRSFSKLAPKPKPIKAFTIPTPTHIPVQTQSKRIDVLQNGNSEVDIEDNFTEVTILKLIFVLDLQSLLKWKLRILLAIVGFLIKVL